MADVLSRVLNALLLDGGPPSYSLPWGCSHISHISFADYIIVFNNDGVSGLRNLIDFSSP